jgi:hypothetical protein
MYVLGASTHTTRIVSMHICCLVRCAGRLGSSRGVAVPQGSRAHVSCHHGVARDVSKHRRDSRSWRTWQRRYQRVAFLHTAGPSESYRSLRPARPRRRAHVSATRAVSGSAEKWQWLRCHGPSSRFPHSYSFWYVATSSLLSLLQYPVYAPSREVFESPLYTVNLFNLGSWHVIRYEFGLNDLLTKRTPNEITHDVCMCYSIVSCI